MNNVDRIFSPIAVDLGATNTGVSIFNAQKPWKYKEADHKGITYHIDINNITFAQEDRRKKRHLKRNIKRKKYSKRLLFLILEAEYNIKLDRSRFEEKAIYDFICHLLNRRGYTYLTLEEADKQKELENNLSELEKEHFEETEINIKEFSTREKSLVDTIKSLAATNPDRLKEIISELENSLPENLRKLKKLPKWEKNQDEKPEQSLHLLLLEYVKIIYEEVTNKKGAVHRRTYQDNILNDIKAHPKIKLFLEEHKIDVTDFHYMICNIANLPLKPLRKYFNNIAFKKSDKWEPEKFLIIIKRWIKSWHTKSASKEGENKQKLLIEIKKYEENEEKPIEFLLKTDPVLTIPPFEDQNNRRPPKCQAMLLDVKKLNEVSPGWEEIVKKLLENYGIEYEIQGDNKDLFDSSIHSLADEYQKAFVTDRDEYKKTSVTYHTVALQRILERASISDPLRLRLLHRKWLELEGNEHITLNSEQDEIVANECQKKLESIFSEKELKIFQGLVNTFFTEIKDARGGLWLEGEKGKQQILNPCGRTPKHKKNEKPLRLRNITGIEIDQSEDFEKFWKERNKIERKSIHGLAKKMEELRKEHGEGFNLYLKDAKASTENDETDNDKKQDSIKKIRDLLPEFQQALKHLKNEFNIKDVNLSKFDNWFSFCQIYNIIEGQGGGNSKACSCCNIENDWRMQQPSENSKDARARGVRLSNDTGSMFDGQLKMILDRLAKEVAQEKIKQIEKIYSSDEMSHLTLEVPLLIEVNQFTFRHDLNTLRKNYKRKRMDEKKIEGMEKKYQSQKDRIKDASKGLCPYTGSSLTGSNGGEIDHIIPRSISRKSHGAVFNSEMNLIYASTKGNREKGNRSYSLNDLHSEYLKKQFTGSKLIQEIEDTILKTIIKLDEKREPIVFDRLPKNEQRDLKHALFSNNQDVKNGVKKLLVKGNQTRVNGTQQYFVKRLHFELTERFSNLGVKEPVKFYYEMYDPYKRKMSYRENVLSSINSIYTKEKGGQQGFASHSIDAAMLVAEHIDEKMSKSSGHEGQNMKEGENIIYMLPKNFELVSIKSRTKSSKRNVQGKPLFQDTMYTVRFVPFLITAEESGFGFNHKNAILSENKEAGQKLFDLLKPFVYYGKDKEKTIEESFEYYQKRLQEMEKPYFYFPFNRRRVLSFLNKSFHADNLSNEDNKQYELLKALEYNTKKEELKNFFSVGSSNKLSDKYNSLIENSGLSKEKDKKVTISIDKKVMGTKLKGEIELPFNKSHWEKLAKCENFKNLKNKELSEVSEAWEKVFDETFHKNQQTKDVKHRKQRSVYSLPRKNGPPRGPVYIKRNTADGKPIFQLQAVEGVLYKGFEEDENTVKFDTSKVVPLDVYSKSKNLTLDKKTLDKKYNKCEKVILMDEVRPIDISEEVAGKAPWLKEISLSPATKARPYLKVIISAEKFMKDIKPELKTLDINKEEELYYKLPGGSLEMSSTKDVDLFAELGAMPKKNQISILRVSPLDKTISFGFVVDGTANNRKEKRVFKEDLSELYFQMRKINKKR